MSIYLLVFLNCSNFIIYGGGKQAEKKQIEWTTDRAIAEKALEDSQVFKIDVDAKGFHIRKLERETVYKINESEIEEKKK